MSWHDQPFSEALTRFGTRVEQGLDENGARQRLARYGPNRLPEPKRAGPLARFARQFHNVLIYVLMAAGTTTAMLGHWIDTAVILAVVMVNAIIGFVQEGKAESALAAIRERLRYADIPKGLQGLGIAFIVTGLLSMAFSAFVGVRVL